MGFYVAECEKTEQYDHGEGCHESGQRQATGHRGINLGPRQHLRL